MLGSFHTSHVWTPIGCVPGRCFACEHRKLSRFRRGTFVRCAPPGSRPRRRIGDYDEHLTPSGILLTTVQYVSTLCGHGTEREGAELAGHRAPTLDLRACG